MTASETDSRRENDPFVDYYVRESASSRATERFQGIMDAIIRVRERSGLPIESLDVADVGCNAGTQSLMWAERGHKVSGLDINEGLLEVARQRSKAAGSDITFVLGTATELPWSSGSMDVCILPELLEHVQGWRECLDEACRVLRQDGTLYVSTTNRMCPVQNEFDVPFYSWFPAPVKRRYERLSVTTRPELVNHAKYPAVHWFTPYGLSRYLRERGFDTYDRFDIMDASGKSSAQRLVLGMTRTVPVLRWLGHVATPYTVVIATKRKADSLD